MKKLMAVIALLAAVPSAPQAQTPPPVIQALAVSGHRQRFDNPNLPAVVRYILIDPGNVDPPLERVALLVLFVGGNGTLGLGAGQLNTGSPNFLARNRHHFAAEGFVVAVVDAANDFNNPNFPDGLRGHRLPDRPLGDKHLADLVAVMNDLRTKYPGLPVWAVGNSRGTVSAAVTALWVSPPADGLVLTSSLTGPDASEDLRSLDLESVTAPVLIVTHRDDACPITKPEDSETLKQRFIASSKVRLMRLNSGSTPLSPPCDPLAPHGFFGIDQKAIDAITKWIRRRED